MEACALTTGILPCSLLDMTCTDDSWASPDDPVAIVFNKSLSMTGGHADSIDPGCTMVDTVSWVLDP